jgi:SAM-dependent methyltransferase
VRSFSDNSGYEKAAHLYDLFDQKENIEFFFHFASQAGEILDIGAGTGRIAIPLAERGVTVCCVEPSPAMRREFEKKLARRSDLSANIGLVTGDAESFEVGRKFPAAFLSGTFDHFLDDKERLSSLLNIRRHLISGGILVFDMFLGLMENSPLSPAGRVKVGNREYRRFVGGRLLPGDKKETVLIFKVYHNDELTERIEERSLVGIANRKDIHQVLTKAGFRVKREWSDYDFTPYQEGEPLLIIEAARQNWNMGQHHSLPD